MTFTVSEFAKVVGGRSVGDGCFTDICIDSRKVKKGDLFVCLKGARVDGHDYIAKAEENGASALLTDRDADTRLPYVVTSSTLEALQAFAAWYRAKLNVNVVAVTGSVGKTTTKEFLAAVLSEGYATYKTQGNMNSETGLPLTLLHVAETDRFAVTELGMSGRGEISLLSSIARPDIAVVTNIGLSHMEQLGSRQAIFEAKMEIVDGMSDGGILVLNRDDDFLSTVQNLPQKIVSYGLNNPECDYYAYNVAVLSEGVSFTAKTPVGDLDVALAIDGVHNVYNSLAAIAVGVLSGLSLAQIGEGLKKMENAPLRQQVTYAHDMTLIEDCYNASPTSMNASIEVLKTKIGRKIAVLGDMLELGEHAGEYHRAVGERLEGVSVLIAYGQYANDYLEGARRSGVLQVIPCKTGADAAINLGLVARAGDVILFKASRGMEAEKVLEQFLKDKNKKDPEGSAN